MRINVGKTDSNISITLEGKQLEQFRSLTREDTGEHNKEEKKNLVRTLFAEEDNGGKSRGKERNRKSKRGYDK